MEGRTREVVSAAVGGCAPTDRRQGRREGGREGGKAFHDRTKCVRETR